jgi:CRP-like cAMP-binding protein
MSAIAAPPANHLLSALPAEELQRLRPFLKRVEMPAGKLLVEQGARVFDVYFPSTAVVALMCDVREGPSCQVAVVGNEGVVGVSAFLGGQLAANRAVVLRAGEGYRLSATALLREFNREGPLNALMLRHLQALLCQMSQTAVCGGHSPIQQLGRWILMCLDRGDGSQIIASRELVAGQLGLGRRHLQKAAADLQAAGFIRWTRGRIDVLNRRALEDSGCDCRRIIDLEYRALLATPKKNPQACGLGATC